MNTHVVLTFLWLPGGMTAVQVLARGTRAACQHIAASIPPGPGEIIGVVTREAYDSSFQTITAN